MKVSLFSNKIENKIYC